MKDNPPKSGGSPATLWPQTCSSLQIMQERRNSPRNTADVILPAAVPGANRGFTGRERFVAMGLSTGGLEALEAVLPYLAPTAPAMLIVQHMPEKVADYFIRHLDKHCEIEVRKACHGDKLRKGQALIAPCNKHMLLRQLSGFYSVELRDGPLVALHRPAIDVLFRSVAYAGSSALGFIMTGLGDDGVAGLKEMRDCGARTIAQDLSICVAPSMPRHALECGAAVETASLSKITELINQWR